MKIISWGPRHSTHFDVVVRKWCWARLRFDERPVRVEVYSELGVRRAYYTDTFKDVEPRLLQRLQNLESYTKRA